MTEPRPYYEPDLALLQKAFGPDVITCHVELLKVAFSWSRVYRLSFAQLGSSDVKSVVVKTIDPHGPATALESERELRFYEQIHPRLTIPKPEVYSLSTDATSGFHVIVMEDLTPTHRTPAHPYRWTPSELHSVLRAYAELHTQSITDISVPWLAPRIEDLIDFERLPALAGEVQAAGIWGDLPDLDRLIDFARSTCERFANEPLRLLHGDTTPANASLPKDLNEAATLIDWQDVGLGLPEFDLAYLDLQPFESAQGMPRAELLNLYWRLRQEIDPEIPAPALRRLRQLHADVTNALWLIVPANRVARQPYMPGTYPHMHWASQFGVVYNRLRSLGEELTESRPVVHIPVSQP